MVTTIWCIIEHNSRDTAQQFGVKFFSCYRYVKKKRENSDSQMKTTYNFKSVFTEEQEISLSEYIQTRAKMAYGLTRIDARKAAFEFAEANRLKMPVQWTRNRMAGKNNFWAQALLK